MKTAPEQDCGSITNERALTLDNVRLRAAVFNVHMPLFYFDTHDGQHSVRDDTGMDLADLRAARKEVLKMLPDIARDVLPDDGNRRDIVADIRDRTGRLVFTAHLSFMARTVD